MMASLKTIFITDEKRAWMRMRSHTVVFDRDPDFARYLGGPSGSVLSMLRIWVAEPDPGSHGVSHYLGSIRHCECGGWMSRPELYRLFRQATTIADQIGERTLTFRARLSRLLRKHFGEAEHPAS